MKYTIYFIAPLVIIVSIIMSGCVEEVKDPYIREIYAEPTFIRPTYDNSQDLNVIFTVRNPLNIRFSGLATFTVDDNCLNVYQDSVEIEVPANNEVSYSPSIRLARTERDLAEGCYGSQKIILTLSDDEGNLKFDQKSVEIKVTR